MAPCFGRGTAFSRAETIWGRAALAAEVSRRRIQFGSRVGRRIPKLFWPADQPTFHWVHMYVLSKAIVFRAVSNPPIREASLPHLKFFAQLGIYSMRIAALDELHGTLERDLGRGQNHMQVIR